MKSPFSYCKLLETCNCHEIAHLTCKPLETCNLMKSPFLGCKLLETCNLMKLPFLQCKVLEACKPHEIAILGLQAFGELQPSWNHNSYFSSCWRTTTLMKSCHSYFTIFWSYPSSYFVSFWRISTSWNHSFLLAKICKRRVTLCLHKVSVLRSSLLQC